MRVVTFKADDTLLERLDRYARAKGVTRSEVIRKAIEFYLKIYWEGDGTEYKYVKLNS